MARKRNTDVRTVGRAQAGRPDATPEAHKHIEGERSLVGALSVPIEQITPDPGQPRKVFDEGRLEELAASIAEEGVLQPLVVRESGLLDDGRTHYMIVVGERRYEASRRAKLTRLPVLVRNSQGATLRILQLIENVQREALEPVDEARAYKELMGLAGIDTRAVAERVHRSHTYVADRLKLIVHDDVVAAVAERVLTPSAAAEVARENDASRRQELIAQARQGTLQKRDVQRARRELRTPSSEQRAAREQTLREVARHMGATEDQVQSAAVARRNEPDLTPAEALALAMHAPPTVPSSQGDAPVASDPEHKPEPTGDHLIGQRQTDTDQDELAKVVARAGGTDAVLRLLTWAADHALSLENLQMRVRALEGYGAVSKT